MVLFVAHGHENVRLRLEFTLRLNFLLFVGAIEELVIVWVVGLSNLRYGGLCLRLHALLRRHH